MKSVQRIKFFSGLAFMLCFLMNSLLMAEENLTTSLNGEFQVTSFGAAGYSVPLKFPAGLHDLQPDLNLVYSSQSGNDVIGVGWSMSSLSMVSRCTAHIQLDEKDRFCLDGQLLLRLDGSTEPYFKEGEEYRTQTESWNRVIAKGTCGNGPCYFEVTGSQGYTKLYGQAQGAQKPVLSSADKDGGSKAVFSWMLNRVEDSYGNYMEYKYTDTPSLTGSNQGTSSLNIPYLSSIEYTGTTDKEPTSKVEFEYEGRDDVISHFQWQTKFIQSYRLAHIKTYSNAQLVSDYQFTYDNSNATDRSILTSLKHCAPNANNGTSCLRPLEFDWENYGLAETGFYDRKEISALQPLITEDLDLITGEFDGNGALDFVTVRT